MRTAVQTVWMWVTIIRRVAKHRRADVAHTKHVMLKCCYFSEDAADVCASLYRKYALPHLVLG